MTTVLCRAEHHQGHVCDRAAAHRGQHAAHDEEGKVVLAWRGGRSRWAVEHAKAKALA